MGDVETGGNEKKKKILKTAKNPFLTISSPYKGLFFIIIIVLAFASCETVASAANAYHSFRTGNSDDNSTNASPANISPANARTAQDKIYSGYYAFRNSRYDSAIADLSEAVKLTPNHPLPYYLRAEAYYQISDYDSAISDYSNAIQFNSFGPIPPYEYMEVVVGVSRVGVPGSGFMYLLSGISNMIEITNISLYSKRGWSYNQKGNFDLAIMDYSMAIQMSPEYARLYNDRGVVYHNKKDYDRAVADYTKALQLTDDRDGILLYYTNRGISFHYMGDYDHAVADFTQALRLTSDTAAQARLFNRRGLAFEGNKTYYQAIEDFTQAARLDPVNTEYRDNLERVRQL